MQHAIAMVNLFDGCSVNIETLLTFHTFKIPKLEEFINIHVTVAAQDCRIRHT
jgi:hypothetical protein